MTNPDKLALEYLPIALVAIHNQYCFESTHPVLKHDRYLIKRLPSLKTRPIKVHICQHNHITRAYHITSTFIRSQYHFSQKAFDKYDGLHDHLVENGLKTKLEENNYDYTPDTFGNSWYGNAHEGKSTRTISCSVIFEDIEILESILPVANYAVSHMFTMMDECESYLTETHN